MLSSPVPLSPMIECATMNREITPIHKQKHLLNFIQTQTKYVSVVDDAERTFFLCYGD